MDRTAGAAGEPFPVAEGLAAVDTLPPCSTLKPQRLDPAGDGMRDGAAAVGAVHFENFRDVRTGGAAFTKPSYTMPVSSWKLQHTLPVCVNVHCDNGTL
jgi:hypothetical protein